MTFNGKKNERVAILFSRMGPYHFARLRAAGKVLPVTFIEIFKEDAIYGWSQVMGTDGFERLTLFENESRSAREMRERIHAALDTCQPSVVVIPGWSGVVAFSTIQWCRTHHVPAILMSESTEWDESRRWWKEWVKGRLVKLCAGALVGGSPHADYLAQLGMPRERIFLGYDVVDNRCFTDRVAEIKNSTSADESKKTPGGRAGQNAAQAPGSLPKKYFLASARFVEKKNLARLLKAYARYRELTVKPENGNHSPAADPWDLVLLGDGPLKADLVRLVAGLGLQPCVHLPGFKQYDELPKYYGRAQVFIHASTTEQWGLVVNEAMASGLPVLVSNRCGCARDLVQEGVNGFTFDPLNVAELAGQMLKISAGNVSLGDFGVASQRIISAWGPERFGDGLKQAIQTLPTGLSSKTKVLDRLLLKLLLLKQG